jgi:nucleotide-binding universal stress UspA family protein
VYGTIVVGYDASHEADLAALAARNLALALGDSVLVVHVQPTTTPAPGTGPQVTEEGTEVQEVLAEAVKIFTDAGIATTGQVHRAANSHIGELLVEVARENNAGLIVVGTRGHGDIHSALLGSTAHQVIHASTTPVMVVRHHA